MYPTSYPAARTLFSNAAVIGPTAGYAGMVSQVVFVNDTLTRPADPTPNVIILPFDTTRYVAAAAAIPHYRAGDDSGDGVFNCGVRRKPVYNLRGMSAAVSLLPVVLPHVGFWNIFQQIINCGLARMTSTGLCVTVAGVFCWNSPNAFRWSSDGMICWTSDGLFTAGFVRPR
jgi:hypothetical protein